MLHSALELSATLTWQKLPRIISLICIKIDVNRISHAALTETTSRSTDNVLEWSTTVSGSWFRAMIYCQEWSDWLKDIRTGTQRNKKSLK